ncbi:MAG: fumarylacetoacetate hydrolase family protein [Acidobacteriaceae bacterium]
MHLVTYKKNGSVAAGLEVNGSIIPLANFGHSDALAFISAGETAWADATAKIKSVPTSEHVNLSEVTLLAPIQNPGKIVCVGLNYRDHAIESKMEIPSVPTVFAKFPSAITGPDAPIVLPGISQKPDWEAEFAVVIGKRGKNVAAKDWEQYVFGYTILNDVSARDIQLATSQWILGKSFDTFAPIGPWIVSKDEIADPHALDIQLTLDGVVQQHSNTRELIFKVPDLIAYISSIVALEPGDIISTGTPAGVGLGQNPQRWLKPGEEVVIQIEKIGTLRNPVIAE